MGIKEKKELIWGWMGILWLLVVLVGYSAIHKPFTLAQISRLSQLLWQVLVMVGIVFLSGGLGFRFFPSAKKWSPLVYLTMQVALGFGILSLATLILGTCFGFSNLIFFFLGWVIIANKSILLWAIQWRVLGQILRKMDKFEKILASGVAFIFFVTFAQSIAPPIAYDSLVYHLTLPKIYLLTGRINYIPELIFWGMPQLQEVGMTLSMSFGGAEAAVLLSWALGILTLVGLFGYLNEVFSSRIAWVTVTVLLTGSGFSALLSLGYVGWTTMLYGFALFVSLVAWRQNPKKEILILAAVFLGFALGTKYTTGILFPVAVFVIVEKKKTKGTKNILLDLFSFISITFLVFSPWAIKNFLATGNPIYPLLFPAGEMNNYRLFLYQNDPAWGDWRDIIFLPWRATILGKASRLGYSFSIGPLLLGLSVFAMIGWHERNDDQKSVLSLAALFTIMGWLIWAIAGRTSLLLIQTRLYLAFFPMWAILAGVGFACFSHLRTARIRFDYLAKALVLLSFSFTIFSMGVHFVRVGVAQTLLGMQSASAYREHFLGAYETVITSLDKLPDDARVLMLWETRGFACVPQCEADETIDRWYADLRSYGSVDQVLAAWEDAGYTHLLYHKLGADFIRKNDPAYTREDWRKLDNLLRELRLEKDYDGIYQIYLLRSTK